MIQIQMGIYRHYKGQLYQVLGIAHDANADALCGGNVGTSWDHGQFKPLGQRTVVVYMPLQLDGAHLGPRMAVRTIEDFLDDVDLHDGKSTVPRFTYLGPELTQEMIGVAQR